MGLRRNRLSQNRADTNTDTASVTAASADAYDITKASADTYDTTKANANPDSATNAYSVVNAGNDSVSATALPAAVLYGAGKSAYGGR